MISRVNSLAEAAGYEPIVVRQARAGALTQRPGSLVRLLAAPPVRLLPRGSSVRPTTCCR